MNRFFSKFPWLRPLGCSLLVCALVLSICLPLLGMRAAEPDNPILQAEPQEITVLQAGNAPGHSGSGDGLNASGSGANGDTESDLTGEAEQPDLKRQDSEAGQSTEPEPAPQEQPPSPTIPTWTSAQALIPIPAAKVKSRAIPAKRMNRSRFPISTSARP